MSATDVRAHSANILRPLVTNVGTKRSLPLVSIAREAKISTAVARGCLLRLADSGLVRDIDRTSDRWEIAHDFVARLVQPIVQHWTRSFWEVARVWVAPAALTLWIIAVLTGAVFYPNWQDEQIRKELDAAGIVPAPSDKSGEVAFQYNGQEADEDQLKRATLLLSKLRTPVVKLDLNSASQLKSLKGVSFPPTLTSLSLGGMRSLEGFPTLPNLKLLAVSGFALKSLSGLPDLPVLESLNVRFGSLEDLVSLPPLPTLRHLAISTYSDKATLVGMPLLPSLESFEIDIDLLSSLKGMPTFPTLRTLSIKGNSLSTLSDLPKLPALVRLEYRPTRTVNLARLPMFPALKTFVLGERIDDVDVPVCR
ncbi:hypothetical protein ACNJYD_34035 [Bradyrhizobium sp. DASA03005]|uniref:hypothetical protein n=1 Tax=Bradyrhizobium sp. SPXBL-02 TaxID=3395912 RepID=UPI003F706E99